MISTTLQRACDADVSRKRSIASTTVFKAVSNPIVKSLLTMSLSIVPGNAIQLIPISVNFLAPI